jgi:hypothetical protein
LARLAIVGNEMLNSKEVRQLNKRDSEKLQEF